MSIQWHYSQDGAQYGPVDEGEIVRLIQDGELAPGSPVLKKGSNDWQPARNHACFQVEIFPKKKRTSVQAAGTTQSPSVTTCDDCTKEISVHAESCPHCGSPAKYALRSWGKGTSSHPVQAKPAVTTTSVKTSQPPRQTTAQPAAKPSNPAVKEKSGLLSGLLFVFIGSPLSNEEVEEQKDMRVGCLVLILLAIVALSIVSLLA